MTNPPPHQPASPTEPMPAHGPAFQPHQPPQPPQGPPPGGPHPYPGQPPAYGPPQQYGGAGGTVGAAPQRAPLPRGHRAVLILAAVSLLGIVLGLSLKENGSNAWDTVDAWGGLAIVGALLTAAPVLGHSVGLTGSRAWQVAAGGAAALGLFWVLFVLPAVGSNPNTTLLATVGVLAGLVAVWVAPGRPDEAAAGDGRGHSW